MGKIRFTAHRCAETESEEMSWPQAWAMDLARTVDPNDESLWDHEIEKIARLLVKVRRDALEEAATAAQEWQENWNEHQHALSLAAKRIRSLIKQEVTK